MLVAKYILLVLFLKAVECSLNKFEKLAEELYFYAFDYLDVKDQIRLGQVNKQFYKMTGITRDRFIRKIIEKMKAEEFAADKQTFKEFKTMISAIMILAQAKQVRFGLIEEFNEAFKIIGIYHYKVHLPNLALIFLKNIDNIKDRSNVVEKAFLHPKKYKNVLKYLTRDYYKCSRNELITAFKRENEQMNTSDFSALIDYNNRSRSLIMIRDGMILSFNVLTTIGIVMFVIQLTTGFCPDPKDCAAFFLTYMLLLSVYMNRYFNDRYEQYLE